MKVVAAAVSPRTEGLNGSIEDVDWIEGLYRAGGKAYFDAVGMHPYLGSFPPEADPQTCASMCFRVVELYRAVIEKYGDVHKKAFITEIGAPEQISTNLGPYDWMKLPAGTRGEYLVRALQMAQRDYPWIMGAVVFNLDYATTSWNPPHSERHWFSLLNPDRSPRPAYVLFKEARRNGTLW